MTVVDTTWRELPTTQPPPPPMNGGSHVFYTHTHEAGVRSCALGWTGAGRGGHTHMDIYARGDICFLRGGQCCVYRKTTKEQCDVLSVDEADIQLYLDLEAIEFDSPVYMEGGGGDTDSVLGDGIPLNTYEHSGILDTIDRCAE